MLNNSAKGSNLVLCIECGLLLSNINDCCGESGAASNRWSAWLLLIELIDIGWIIVWNAISRRQTLFGFIIEMKVYCFCDL